MVPSKICMAHDFYSCYHCRCTCSPLTNPTTSLIALRCCYQYSKCSHYLLNVLVDSLLSYPPSPSLPHLISVLLVHHTNFESTCLVTAWLSTVIYFGQPQVNTYETEGLKAVAERMKMGLITPFMTSEQRQMHFSKNHHPTHQPPNASRT